MKATRLASLGFSMATLLVVACASSTRVDDTEVRDAAADANSSSTDATRPDALAEIDAAEGDDAANTCGVTTDPPGETCAPFGDGKPCGEGCFAANGYVCIGGKPPNIAGCQRAQTSSFGNTYCCPTLECVRVPSEDGSCTGKPGGTKIYSCPVDKAGKPTAQPPSSSCVKVTGPKLDVYDYQCCPN